MDRKEVDEQISKHVQEAVRYAGHQNGGLVWANLGTAMVLTVLRAVKALERIVDLAEKEVQR